MNQEEDDKQNYKPSRFLLKKQQALIHQAQRLKSLKNEDEPSDHKIIFTMTPDLEKKRCSSSEPQKNIMELDKNIEPSSNLLDLSRRPLDRNAFASAFRRDDKRNTNTGENIKITFGMTNKNSRPVNKQNNNSMEIEKKPKKASDIKKDTIFYPIELPLNKDPRISTIDKNENYLIAEEFIDSLSDEKLALFQMPQILPFKESMSAQNNSTKEKLDKNIDFKSEENNNELLTYLMKDNLDSMGHEIIHPYTGFIQNTESNENQHEKKEKKKQNTNNFECEEGFHLGKLQILRDNRAKMVFGDIEFEILNGIDSKFCQELIGIDFLEKSAKPKAYFLTNINKKFICKPSLPNLLD